MGLTRLQHRGKECPLSMGRWNGTNRDGHIDTAAHIGNQTGILCHVSSARTRLCMKGISYSEAGQAVLCYANSAHTNTHNWVH